MPRDTGLANRLRKRGIPVVEIGGWATRGNTDFAPYGSINHHTAGSATGIAPSLAICTYGRPDLPGPLCHVLLGRDLRAYVIAAGRANHAGVGNWNGLTTNRRLHGLEIEHTGFGPSPKQLKVALQIHAAFLEASGSSHNAAYVAQHFEYALPAGRKVDFRSLSPDYTPNSFRNGVAAALKTPSPTPPPQEDDDMPACLLMRANDRPMRAIWEGKVLGFSSQADADEFMKSLDAMGVKKDYLWCTEKQYDGISAVYNETNLNAKVNDLAAKVAEMRLYVEGLYNLAKADADDVPPIAPLAAGPTDDV